LEAIVAAEPHGITRNELVAELGLSTTTISNAVDRLREAIDAEDAPRAGRSGPPPKVLRVPRNAGVVLALEIHGSRLRACMFDARGEPLGDVYAESAEVEDNPMDSLQRLADIARDLTHDVDKLRIIGVGIAVTGPVDPGAGGGDLRHGVLREDTIMRRWGGISPSSELEQLLLWDSPFLVDNDATLSAMAERRWGAARGMDDVIYVAWSQGIGAGLVINGSIARGSSGIAGELGHCAVILKREQRARIRREVEDDRRLQACPRCGRYCLESVAGIAAMLSEAGLARDASTSDLLTAADAENGLPPEEKVVTPAIKRAATYLGQALGSCVNLLNPQAIIIGGEFPPSAASLYRGDLISELKRKAIGASFSDVGVLPSELGVDAALRGAAAHVLDRELEDFLLEL
jgi:predicted NBD/HSP70 family sugar kinase